MNGGEKGLQAISLIAIVILSIVTIDLLNEKYEDSEIVYVVIDNRITIDEDYTIEELDRSEVARVASFNIRIFGDTKMSNQTVVAELVDIFQRYDMIAVQEIKDIDEEVPYLFLDELNNFNNLDNSSNITEWELVLSERSGMQEDDKNSQEQYAFYYRPTVFSPVDNGTLYDDSGNDSFQREPFMAKFVLLDTYGNSTGTDIVFVNIHTKPL